MHVVHERPGFNAQQRQGISDHQQSWGYADGPWKGPGPPLLVAADLERKYRHI